MAEIEKFEGDLFWNVDDIESSVHDPEDEIDNVSRGDIVTFEQAQRLPNFYGVHCGEGKARYFTTEAEARACSASVVPVSARKEEV